MFPEIWLLAGTRKHYPNVDRPSREAMTRHAIKPRTMSHIFGASRSFCPLRSGVVRTVAMAEALAAVGRLHGDKFDSPGDSSGRISDRQQPVMVPPSTGSRRTSG